MANFTTVVGTKALTQNVEFSVAQGVNYSAGSPKTTTGYVGVWLDLTTTAGGGLGLVAGDLLEIRIYRGISGGTAAAVDVITIKTPQMWTPNGALLVGSGWDVTVKLTTATGRTIGYEAIQDTNDVNVASITAAVIAAASFAANAITSSVLAANCIGATQIATDAIDADAIKTDAVTEIQSGLALATALTTAQADLTTLIGRLTSGRAVNLDNLDAAISTRAPSSTALSTAQWTNARATLQDNLDAAVSTRAAATALTTAQTDLTTLTGRLTSGRALGLDNLDAAITTRASSAALATVQADTDDLQTRLPAALVGGRMSSDVGSWLGTAAATPTVAGIPKVEEATLEARLTSGRATNLDSLDAAITSRAAASTAVSNVDYTSARATKIDNLDAAMTTRAAAATAISSADYTLARAAKLDNLDAAVSTRASAAALAAVQTDTDDIQTRLPSSLDGSGNLKVAVQSIVAGAITAIADAVFAYVIEAAPVGATTFIQRLRVGWSIFGGNASGLAIQTAGTEHFRDGADTKDRATFALALDGTRVPGTFDGT